MPLVSTPRNRRLATACVFAALVTTTAALAQQPAPAAAPPAMFAVCQACHESTAGASASVGPNLFNVGGRKAGSIADYDYSASDEILDHDLVLRHAGGLHHRSQQSLARQQDGLPWERLAATAKAIADYLMTLKG